MEVGSKIVFYDGDCGLCNRSVAFVMKNEKRNDIKFAPIQSEFTTSFFNKKGWEKPDLSTVYFYSNHKIYTKSTAALQLCKELKFPYVLLVAFMIVPRFIRDYFYRFIAKRRRRYSKTYCFMPNNQQKKRFLS